MELLTPGLGLVFWQTVVFLALVFLLGKFAWKPILHSLKIREESIEDALKSAERAKEEMAQLKADNQKLLDQARVERDQILKDATAAASRLREEAKADAQKISDKMVEDARGAINAEKQAALAEVKDQVARLSLEVAEIVLKDKLKDDKSQKDLVSKYLKEIKLN